jgi:hypothetical protein
MIFCEKFPSEPDDFRKDSRRREDYSVMTEPDHDRVHKNSSTLEKRRNAPGENRIDLPEKISGNAT